MPYSIFQGPIMLSHGLGVTVGIFSLDTVRKNIVEYLVAKKYDVWLFEWRAAASGKTTKLLGILF